MKNKQIIAGAGAVGLGALFAWAFTADYYENKMRRREELLGNLLRRKTEEVIELSGKLLEGPHQYLDDEDDDESLPTMEEAIEEIYKDSAPVPAPESELVDESVEIAEEGTVWTELTEDSAPEGETAEAGVTDETPEKTRSNLQGLIDEYTANPDDHDTFTNRVRTYNEVDRTPPFVISVGDYAHDEEGEDYAKLTLTYFPAHRTLLDDGQEPIEDVNAYVGWKNLNRFGDESGDSDVVFIRNRALLTDFEVVREEDSDLPLHVKYGMTLPEFEVNKASGILKLRPEDQ